MAITLYSENLSKQFKENSKQFRENCYLYKEKSTDTVE